MNPSHDMLFNFLVFYKILNHTIIYKFDVYTNLYYLWTPNLPIFDP